MIDLLRGLTDMVYVPQTEEGDKPGDDDDKDEDDEDDAMWSHMMYLEEY